MQIYINISPFERFLLIFLFIVLICGRKGRWFFDISIIKSTKVSKKNESISLRWRMLCQVENKSSFMRQPFQENVNIPSKSQSSFSGCIVNCFQGIKSTFSVWMVLLPPQKTPFCVKILIPREELRKMGVFKAFLRF